MLSTLIMLCLSEARVVTLEGLYSSTGVLSYPFLTFLILTVQVLFSQKTHNCLFVRSPGVFVHSYSSLLYCMFSLGDVNGSV